MSKREMNRLLSLAADEYEDHGVVFTDTQMRLAAEGYDLAKLEADVERVLGTRQAASAA